MNSTKKFTLAVLFASGLLCNGAWAAYLDLTDEDTVNALISNGYAGSIDGVGFTLTSVGGGINLSESYDGSSANLGCQANSGPLACEIDGAGIGNDEISGLSLNSGQVMILEFATTVMIHSLDFLDLYTNSNGTEQATVTIDGVTLATPVFATGSSGDGGYASLDLLALGQTIEFTAFQGLGLQDDRDNDYAFAGIEISAVPVPAAIWLFGTALIGLIGFSRRKSRVTG